MTFRYSFIVISILRLLSLFKLVHLRAVGESLGSILFGNNERTTGGHRKKPLIVFTRAHERSKRSIEEIATGSYVSNLI